MDFIYVKTPLLLKDSSRCGDTCITQESSKPLRDGLVRAVCSSLIICSREKMHSSVGTEIPGYHPTPWLTLIKKLNKTNLILWLFVCKDMMACTCDVCAGITQLFIVPSSHIDVLFLPAICTVEYYFGFVSVSLSSITPGCACVCECVCSEGKPRVS